MGYLSNAIGIAAELSLWICFIFALAFGAILSLKITPIIRDIQKEISYATSENFSSSTHPFLKAIEDKYILLMKNTDNLNAMTFSAGETSGLRILRRRVSASKLQYYVNQAPALLVSLGLLGTFAGLTTGLGEIEDVLRPNISPQEAVTSLGNIITPMSLAFRTSLLGLSLSLTLTVLGQITGWRHQIEQLDDSLAAWLETIVPIKHGKKLSSPLRNAIVELNKSSNELPNKIADATRQSIQSSFSVKLDEFFELYTNLATETARTINSLDSLAGSFRESSGDYFEAAKAFNQCSFADDLQKSVGIIKESGQDIAHTSEKLCEKMISLKDGLSGMNSHWDVLTALSAEQLRNANKMLETNKLQEQAWLESVNIYQTNSGELVNATKELRNTRLEVGRDRKAMQESANALQERLTISSKLDSSYVDLTNSYKNIVENLRFSTEQIGDLHRAMIERSRNEADTINSKSQAAASNFEETYEKLISLLKNEISSSQNYNSEIAITIEQQTKNHTLLAERTEKLNAAIINIIETAQKDDNNWNHPWRFIK